MKSKSKTKRLESAALVKLKYHLLTGKYDEGFRRIFDGVLQDLELEEKEVDLYIERHRTRLTAICDEKKKS